MGQTAAKMTIEDALKRLETIIAELGKEDISLDESLKLYKEGVKISEICKKNLEDVEKEIQVLSTEG